MYCQLKRLDAQNCHIAVTTPFPDNCAELKGTHIPKDVDLFND